MGSCGTSDIYKQDLLKEFFDSMQKNPPKSKLLFALYIVNFLKKNVFFLQILVTFGERIPKMYNTWGLVFSNPTPESSWNHHKQTLALLELLLRSRS